MKLPRYAAVVALATVLALPAWPVTQAAAAPSEPTDELVTAVERDLGMTWADYVQAGERAEQAAELAEVLADDPGFEGIAVTGAEVVISGEGAAVAEAARADGVRAERPTEVLDETTIRERYLAEVDAQGAGLIGIGWTTNGWVLTVADPQRPGVRPDGRAGRSPEQFATAAGLTVQTGQLATTRADILGGEGWGHPTVMPRCSIGFAAFAPDGRQSMLTAGHCTNEGTLAEARWEGDTQTSLGRLAYQQFGGTDNTTNSSGTPGTDLAAYAGASTDLRAAQSGYPGMNRITGSTRPVAGAPVCTSGRATQRWHCSTIETVGPFAVQGPRGSGDVRWIQGFSTRMRTAGGDSGTGMVTGLRAVGVLSAGANYGGIEYTFGASLDPVLARGYTLEVWLNEPTAAAAVGEVVRGRIAVDDRVPANTVVRFEGASPRSATVGADGSFAMAAPTGPGRLVATDGRSRSATVDFDPRFGSATGPLVCGLAGGGCFRGYTGGLAYTTSATGTHIVRGAIYERWAALGWETGFLGYPTSPEMCGLSGGGCWQVFTGGRMYWSPATGAQPVRGAIGMAWNGTGFEHGFLGYPTSPEFCGLRGGGCFQRYQAGTFYWSPATGAYWVRGAIAVEWGALGWETSGLGYPVSGEFCGLRDAGCFQRYAGGTIYWSARTGAYPVWGAIADYWAANRWETGRFGYPISRESCTGVDATRTCTQRFAGGTITWTPTLGARG